MLFREGSDRRPLIEDDIQKHNWFGNPLEIEGAVHSAFGNTNARRVSD
jgi:hypothetical protein